MAKVLRTFFFSSYPHEKAAEIEQAIRHSGYSVVPHPDPDVSNICVLAGSKNNMLALCHALAKLAPGIKWHGPVD
jgi:hypothetical protein